VPKSAPRFRPMPRMAPTHTSPQEPQGDSWRAGLTTAERGYGGRWQRARETFLARPENVLCRMCAEAEYVVLATIVDHVKPHRGDRVLFWDSSNWQPLCKPCHDGRKRREEAEMGKWTEWH
jgi:5-methylcytosine-specific restriction endonuclease McrA